MNVYPPGSLIAGRYEVASRPLMGGMGIVYLCYDHVENRPVALKTFKPEYLPDRAARDRFLREGDTWIKLERHPNIVHAYNVVRVGDGTEVYLVLELIAKEQGRQDASLRSWLTPGQPTPPEQAMLFALQVIRGMQHATNKIPGFVHRDLKPENLLIGSDKLTNANINRLRVTDLGLASVVGEVREAEIAGTPLYMAPEQWRGETVSMATDIYALGCIMFEMLAGERAVSGSSLSALEQAHHERKRKALPANTPLKLRGWVEKCLRVAPSDRYVSWAETEVALEGAYSAMMGRRLPVAEVAGEMRRAERVATSWALCAMGASYLDIGQANVALRYFERAVESGKQETEKALESVGLMLLGLGHAHLGEALGAIRFYEESLTIARAIGDRRGEAATLGNLGEALRNLGEVRRAIGYYEQALTIDREFGDRQGEGATLGNLGIAYVELGEVRRAIGLHELCLVIHRAIRDRRGEGKDLGNLGVAYELLGEVRRAIELHEQHLTIAREIGDRGGEGDALGNLGLTYNNLGDVRHAIGYFEQQLIVTREIGDRQGEGAALGNLGLTYENLGDVQRAIRFYEESLMIARAIADRRLEGNALGKLGTAYRDLGEVRRAISYYEQRLGIARAIGDRRGEGAALGNLGIAFADLGEVRRGVGYYEQALTIARSIGDRRSEGNALGNLGLAYTELEEVRRAIGYLEQQLTITREIGDSQGGSNALGNLGNAYYRLGEVQRAIGYYQQQLTIARDIGDQRGEGTALGNLGIAYSDDVGRAIEYLEQAIAIQREIGDISGEAKNSLNMAILYYHQGDAAKTLLLARHAQLLFQQVGSPYAQNAENLIAKLEGRAQSSGEAGVDEGGSRQQFAQLIEAVVVAARGNMQAKGAVEHLFPQLEQSGFRVVEPIQQIWRGERNESKLTHGLDDMDSAIVRKILEQLE